MVKKCLIRLSPKKTSTLDLHQQERSGQANAINIDGLRTVYSHTHSIIASSNARAGEQVKVAQNKHFCQCLQLAAPLHSDNLNLSA